MSNDTKAKAPKVLVGDFETTVYEGQTSTEVWASACVELGTENVLIFNSIDAQFTYLKSLDCDIVIYYHNLKFDGAFWLSYLLKDLGLQQGYNKLTDDAAYVEWKKDSALRNNQFKYAISDKGQWYNIKVKVNNHIIEMRDSLKLLPFSVKKLGKGFNTKHRKLEMEYKGKRYAGWHITDEEKQYIANDVLVVKEALEFMFNEGHNRVTIGSCCLDEYKKVTKYELDYKDYFPDLYQIEIPKNIYGSENAGSYIRKSYKGGWCYVVRGKESKIFSGGTTADVNSLYPSMMHSESGNRYPIGKPTFFHGDEVCRYEYDFIKSYKNYENRYYFFRIRTRFRLKENKLPCIQIKGNKCYDPTEWLETSNVIDSNGVPHTCYRDDLGEVHEARVTMTLTMTDLALIQEQYYLYDMEMLDGCWFHTELGIFDTYINKYRDIKMISEGAMRELAKLFLNNLYGKMAASMDSSFKVAYLKDDGSIGFYTMREEKKKPGYIAIGSAITSYARNFTIRAAQANYYGVNQPGFIYGDTDSMHCDLPPESLRGIVADDVKFCCWKLEACWDTAIFTRQKTYIEHVTHENLQQIENPYYNVKCAGMPDKCKDLFIKSITRYEPKETDNFTAEELSVIQEHYTLSDFNIGLTIPGKLIPRRIPGGVLLVETSYKMW